METIPVETILETIAETIPGTIAETIPAETAVEVIENTAETVTQVIEVVETIDYTPMLNDIAMTLQSNQYLLGFLSSVALFFVVVALCYFCYKFFRIFF